MRDVIFERPLPNQKERKFMFFRPGALFNFFLTGSGGNGRSDMRVILVGTYDDNLIRKKIDPFFDFILNR